MTDDNNNTPPPEDPNTQPPAAGSDNKDTGSAQSFSFDEAALEDPDDSALNRRGSSLGGNSSKAMMFGTVLVLGTGIILYYLFSDSSAPPPPKGGGAVVPTKPSGEIIAQPASSPPAASGISAPSSAPSAPPAPPPPPPPPPPPAPPAAIKAKNAPPPQLQAPLAPPEIRAIAPTEATAKVIDKQTATRMRSNMLLVNGGKTVTDDKKLAAQQALDSNDPNAEFASNAIAASETETTVATKLSNLGKLIAQGKIINAVLETAINTDLPGTLRATISRDVYAEAGREVLIPKGSRLIGTYNTGVLRGQKRVLIVWTRIITPTGIDIEVGSPAVDALGKAGVEGMVDNKFAESFSAALLTSLISIGVAVAADGNLSGTSSSTTNTDGSTTTSGSAGSAAATSAVQAIGGVGTEVVGNLLDLRPTITIDQGTRINVFVNKDIVIPGPDNSGGLFVE
ncbi:MAG: TrbI/VirB10 family protein [Alphaproteobacteria bacterium]|nr:TrbI/VirB10 family protein [Alphaproteobacteria bacterium]